MRIYFDTEFTGLHQNTTLISLGIISDNNSTFYAEFVYYNKTQVDDWIQEHVINNLILNNYIINSSNYKLFDEKHIINLKGYSDYIKDQLNDWLKLINPNKDIIEVWSDCYAYDWVLFNQLYGHALKIPKEIYYIPFDLSTALKLNKIDPDINREEFANIKDNNNLKHNSLWDAKIIKKCIEKLNI